MKRWLAVSLCMAMLAGLGGCGKVDASDVQDLMANITPNPRSASALSEKDAELLTAAAVKLLQNCDTSGNTLLSPFSVLCAVGMTANGAAGTTKAQLEEFFGMDTAELARCMQSWVQMQGGKEGLLSANSVWFCNDSLKVRNDFLQTNADYYGADVFQASFDENTCNELNRWVSEHTDGRITELLDSIPENAVMYLVNALCFRLRWAEPYTTNKVSPGVFTTQSGEERIVEMMSSREYLYLEDEAAIGFLKPYEDDQYAFAALLPSEGVSMQEFLAGLDGERLFSLLTGKRSESVRVLLPKFEAEYEAELSEAFRRMGVTEAFDPDAADFSRLGTAKDNLYISRILHKTNITVNETGTEAAAATAVEMMTKSARPMRDKSVVLDRPFVYMIVDLEANIPVFIGTVTDIGG